MNTPAAGPLRLLRCGVFGIAATALALIGHLVGGGHSPAPAATALLLGICGMSGWLLAARRRGFLALLGGLVQVLVHATLSVAAQPGSASHLHAAQAAGMPILTGIGMLGWHLVAVGVTAALLSRGEQAVWRLLCYLRIQPAPTAPLPWLVLDVGGWVVVEPAGVRPRRVVVGGVRRRGPPAPGGLLIPAR